MLKTAVGPLNLYENVYKPLYIFLCIHVYARHTLYPLQSQRYTTNIKISLVLLRRNVTSLK